MNRPLGMIAACTFVGDLAVHVLAVFGYAPLGMLPMLLFAPMTFVCLCWYASNNRKEGFDGPGGPLLSGAFPMWARWVLGLTMLYALVNFFLFFRATGGGTLECAAHGHCRLMDHGRLIRELDEVGAEAVTTWTLRLFTGGFLPFVLLPALGAFVRPKAGGRQPAGS